MGIMQNLLLNVVYLLMAAFDILTSFLVVKIIYQKWNPKWLRRFESVGMSWFTRFTKTIDTLVSQTTKHRLTEKGLMAIGLLALLLIKFMILGLCSEILSSTG